MKAVLTLYFYYFLHWDETLSTTIYHAFSGLCYFMPVFGAIIADSYLGKFKTIIYLSIVYVIGHVVKSISAVPPLGDHNTHVILSILGLFLIAVGTGGIKPCVAAFGGDQFEEEHAEERSKFFSIFYLAINLGSLISTFATPALRGDVKCFGSDCYALAFGVPALLMVVALVVFISGSSMYKTYPSQGNIMLSVCKCIRFAVQNRWKHRSEEHPKREHWLDWARDEYPNQVINEVKMVTRVLFLYIPLPMFWALFDQQGSRWTLQATRMNPDFGGFIVKPDQMQTLNPFLILVFIPMFDLIIYPFIKMLSIDFRPIRKMAAGMVLAALAFAVAAIVEVKVEESNIYMPVAKESLLQVLNLASNPVEIQIKDSQSFMQPSLSIENPDYRMQSMTAETEDFSFNIKYNGTSSSCKHTLSERHVYSLIVYQNGTELVCKLVKDLTEKPSKGLAALRFINLGKETANITVGSRNFGSIEGTFGVSDYATLERGYYRKGKCQIGSNEFSLDIDLLDFGGSYTVIIEKVSGQNVLIQKSEDIPANKVHIAWQIPQYVLMSAGEVIFSVTGLEFSYSQAPSSMKSVLQAGWLLTIAFGNLVVLIIAQTTALRQWLEYILFAVLLTLVCILFSFMGYFYVPMDVTRLQENNDDGKQKHESPSNDITLNLVKKKINL
ncbi:solute carrier family 15 member 2 isoform X2 [Rhinatrema bivittatum]|nr:solute carrier family 15 member 2 isoform X2 [Rhinatrema bivittatum]XP_029461072.1 solute carrier family 15 member 2 isoform X2 [Rhinatrema bivittatum]XP_029461073.1 solute carrier family 15 member 2 isoform X2 [Rhinatrema bivittatum]